MRPGRRAGDSDSTGPLRPMEAGSDCGGGAGRQHRPHLRQGCRKGRAARQWIAPITCADSITPDARFYAALLITLVMAGPFLMWRRPQK